MRKNLAKSNSVKMSRDITCQKVCFNQLFQSLLGPNLPMSGRHFSRNSCCHVQWLLENWGQTCVYFKENASNPFKHAKTILYFVQHVQNAFVVCVNASILAIFYVTQKSLVFCKPTIHNGTFLGLIANNLLFFTKHDTVGLNQMF